ncbi:class I SAM-dependent methyltransferase [Parahaliea aestuarii]|uniref:Class I SAM-dependent methyltransferase n=1 Tax=Parahaliea aestuarii TaxID=1852021 RepID=A0A5C8ZNH1_9GAMM|nr:class I SAM-dependent methyltransferase [Parahaliea aestuarii]TXS90056.1 class I SAM-dependent methyltransferase [Parahaliea aestuarii]
MSDLLYFPPSLQRFEPKRMVFSTWVDHLPFAYDLVEAIRPKTVVELGVYNGLSFFTFCQAMVENDIDGVAYAIDCWEGDEHTDAYDDSIFKDVQQHAREHYRGITYLMKMFFHEALRHFEEDSIDLLHIDGLHTYEAVKEDFESWYPKVKPGGIVLFHDVMARIKDFGAWKFFEELEGSHPETFKFNHGFGLGVLRKPGGERPDLPLLNLLFSGDEHNIQKLRQTYVHASHFLEARRQAKRFKELTSGKNKGGQGKQAGGQ